MQATPSVVYTLLLLTCIHRVYCWQKQPPFLSFNVHHFHRCPIGYGTTTALQGTKSPLQDQDCGDDFDSLDVEAARQKLEYLVGGSDQQPQQHPDHYTEKTLVLSSKGHPETFSLLEENSRSTLPLPGVVPPLLTSIDRERRRKEIELLRRLHDGDEALPDLWNLWFYERGSAAGTRLVAAEEVSRDPRRWHEAEHALKLLVTEFGLHWVEPLHRLATLYHKQGRWHQAEQLFRTVLAVKPWHVGALSGIVISYGDRHAVHAASTGAALRLPKLSPFSNRRRQQWVSRAVEQAETLLRQAEERLQKTSFGQEDLHVSTVIMFPISFVLAMEEQREQDQDAWQ